MANLLRVLIVEDNDDDRQLLAAALQSGGYDLVHDCVASADEMRAALDRGVWDVVISDYSMPGFSGIEALRVVQERGLDLPFIIVSGVIGEDTAVELMRSGAHDYLGKSNFKRLLPAVARELREAAVRRDTAWRNRRCAIPRRAFARIFSRRDGHGARLPRQALPADQRPVCDMLGYRRDELLG